MGTKPIIRVGLIGNRASGDLETLANFVVLLRAAGVRADLLLPRITANSAALEVMGADPAFDAGRRF